MKNHFLIVCILVLLCGCNSGTTKSIANPEDDLRQAGIAFSELREGLDDEGRKLWNHKLDGPVMLVNRDTRAIVANEQDTKGELKKQGEFYTGILPENINIANTAFDWNGKHWTMVFLPLPETKEQRLRLLIHESFHRIQPEIGFDNMEEIQSAHLDTKEGRILFRLEMEALKQALQSEEPEHHIKNALLFRHYRNQVFPGSKSSENSLEIIEGLAEYTGLILSGMDDDALHSHFVSQIGELESQPAYMRSFAYYEFPVYGYFMKQHDEAWNLKINKNTNLTDFMSELFCIDYPDLTMDEVIRIGRSYNVEPIIRSEEERELKHKELVKAYMARFLGDSILRISLENMNIGFNPSNLMPLDTFGTVYPNLRITDNWGILEVDSCGALLSPDWCNVTISFPEMITDTLITGRGWRLKVTNGWKLKEEGAIYSITH